MTKIEIGGMTALIVAIATGAVYLGTLQGRVSSLEKTVTTFNNQVEALKQLDIEGAKQSLEETMKRYSPVPSKAILAWAGQPNEMPAGWIICGQNETLNLDGQFLTGTSNWNEIGGRIGDSTHRHSVDTTTGRPERETRGDRIRSGRGDERIYKMGGHRHEVDGRTERTEHIPPSVKVFFLCKEWRFLSVPSPKVDTLRVIGRPVLSEVSMREWRVEAGSAAGLAAGRPDRQTGKSAHMPSLPLVETDTMLVYLPT